MFPILSCSRKGPEIPVIDIENAFSNMESASLSSFVSSIKYIPLESSSLAMISDYPGIIVDETIIVRNTGFNSSTPLMLFNKQNGKFDHYIGKIGRGPNEYSFPVKDFFNIYNNHIYTSDNTLREIKVLSLEGNIIDKFNTFDISDPSFNRGIQRASFDTYLNEDTFVSYISNSTGSVKTKLLLFNRDKVLKTFPNYLSWGDIDPKKNNTPYFSPKFFRWDKALYFKEMFNDTLFQVTTDNLIPRYVFNLGKNGLPYEQQNKIMPTFGQLDNNYFLIEDIDENDDFIFFQLAYQKKTYTGIFNKKENETTICELTDNTASGLTDDINGFMPLIPKTFTDENEMVCILSPLDILKWLKENPDKSEKLKVRMTWLESLSPTSNPIVVIAKCK